MKIVYSLIALILVIVMYPLTFVMDVLAKLYTIYGSVLYYFVIRSKGYKVRLTTILIRNFKDD